jgi:hypothetical protein
LSADALLHSRDVAATGSRGGLLTLAIMFLMYFVPLPSSQKIVVAVLPPDSCGNRHRVVVP